MLMPLSLVAGNTRVTPDGNQRETEAPVEAPEVAQLREVGTGGN
jgi:hypothetical protein